MAKDEILERKQKNKEHALLIVKDGENEGIISH